MSERRVVCLDRDGVINEDSPEYIRNVDEWRPIDGSLEAIAALSVAGYRVFVVSNQSGIARGLFTPEALEAINARMLEAVEAAGGRLAGIYVCPHGPDDGCECRKPATGLLRRIEREHGVSLEDTPLIGDKWSDIAAARAVGARPILVRSGHGQATLDAHGGEIDECYHDLAAAVTALLAEDR